MIADHQPKIVLPPPFVDPRGSIQPILQSDLKSAQLITSVRGSLRANHYHRQDSHYMFVVAGSFNYYWRDAGSDQPLQMLRVGTGDLIFTPAMVEHLVEFLDDTSFVNFSDQNREQAAYEADIVRLELSPGDATVR